MNLHNIFVVERSPKIDLQCIHTQTTVMSCEPTPMSPWFAFVKRVRDTTSLPSTKNISFSSFLKKQKDMNLWTNTDILAALELWQKEVAASSDAPTVDDTKPTVDKQMVDKPTVDKLTVDDTKPTVDKPTVDDTTPTDDTKDDTKPTDDTKPQHNMHGVIMMFLCEFAADSHADVEILGRDFYARYKTWCTAKGVLCVSQQSFLVNIARQKDVYFTTKTVGGNRKKYISAFLQLRMKQSIGQSLRMTRRL